MPGTSPGGRVICTGTETHWPGGTMTGLGPITEKPVSNGPLQSVLGMGGMPWKLSMMLCGVPASLHTVMLAMSELDWRQYGLSHSPPQCSLHLPRFMTV